MGRGRPDGTRTRVLTAVVPLWLSRLDHARAHAACHASALLWNRTVAWVREEWRAGRSPGREDIRRYVTSLPAEARPVHAHTARAVAYDLADAIDLARASKARGVKGVRFPWREKRYRPLVFTAHFGWKVRIMDVWSSHWGAPENDSWCRCRSSPTDPVARSARTAGGRCSCAGTSRLAAGHCTVTLSLDPRRPAGCLGRPQKGRKLPVGGACADDRGRRGHHQPDDAGHGLSGGRVPGARHQRTEWEGSQQARGTRASRNCRRRCPVAGAVRVGIAGLGEARRRTEERARRRLRDFNHQVILAKANSFVREQLAAHERTLPDGVRMVVRIVAGDVRGIERDTKKRAVPRGPPDNNLGSGSAESRNDNSRTRPACRLSTSARRTPRRHVRTA
ncbi:hypothetical protein SGLAM104S_03343 [Streptomyces glaucescens]